MEQPLSKFIFALNLDGSGGAEELEEASLVEEMTHTSLTWIHMNYGGEGAREWLRDQAGLDEVVVDALTSEDPRPRCSPHRDGLLVVFRGINGNPGQDREDMVSVRFWVDDRKIISTRQRRLFAPSEIRAQLSAGSGPNNPADLLVAMAHFMNENIADVVQDIDGKLDELEEDSLTLNAPDLRRRLGDVRREAVMVRRYLAPQRDALSTLYGLRLDWFDERAQHRVREVGDRTIRFIEDLDAIRERGLVTHEDLTNQIAERMNRIMYFLTLITGIFLPLGLLTGLLGINVGGMPGADEPSAFWIVCGLLGVLVAVQVAVFRKMKWL